MKIGGLGLELVLLQLEQITGTSREKPKFDRAHDRRVWFENWYERLGFNLPIQTPPISDEEFVWRVKKGHALFYRPSTSLISYEEFMTSVGAGEHSTVKNHSERANIGWEPTETGYWFWAEVSQKCPRMNTAWDALIAAFNATASQSLISLEEYVIVWHACIEAGDSQVIDMGNSWTWLRTRFLKGSIIVESGVGGIHIAYYGKREDLTNPLGATGGRAVEIVVG